MLKSELLRPALSSLVSGGERWDILGLGLGELEERPPLMELRVRKLRPPGKLFVALPQGHRAGDIESFLVVGPKLGVIGSIFPLG